MQLHRTLVRLHLEICIQFWLPYFRKDVKVLKWVKRKFTRTLPGLEVFGYRERLDWLGMFSLGSRWLRGDFIEKHKWGRWSEPFSQGGNIQHVGHSYKVRWGLFQRRYAGQVVFKSIGHLLLYLVFEAAEVCSTWNALPGMVVKADNTVAF